MFDTVYFRQQWKVLQSHPDWEFESRGRFDPGSSRILKSPWLQASHKNNLIKVYGPKTDLITKVYVSSLPTLLNGQNAHPLNGRREVAAALTVLDFFLEEIGVSTTSREFTRVDICLQLPGISFPEIEQALQFSRLPRSRLSTKRYVGESITFRRNQTELIVYDKSKKLEASGIPNASNLPSVVKCELRLNNEDLERHLGKGGIVRELDVDLAYQVLRNHLLSMGGNRPTGVTNLASFLAYMEKVSPGALDTYVNNCVGLERRKELRREVSRLMGSVGSDPIPWEDLLPASHPPSWEQIRYETLVDLRHGEYIVRAKEKHGLIESTAADKLLAKMREQSSAQNNQIVLPIPLVLRMIKLKGEREPKARTRLEA